MAEDKSKYNDMNTIWMLVHHIRTNLESVDSTLFQQSSESPQATTVQPEC